MGKLLVTALLTTMLTAPGVQDRVDALVDHGLPGVLSTVDQRTYRAGTADRRTGAPMPRNGELRAGSIGKPFVAVTVLRLVAQGELGLDDRVSAHLPELPTGEITVRQLLQHTSGLDDYGTALPRGAEFVARRFEHHHRAELIRYGLARPRLFEPGRGWAYVNTGYLILGELVERVTGEPWTEVATREVIRPLGLRRTYFPRPYETGLRGPHPHGYLNVDGRLVDVTEVDTSYLDAAGSVVSTPGELNRFFTALLSGRLLPEHLMAELTKTVPGGPTAPEYGLGLEVFPLSCGRLAGHGGEMHGFSGLSGVLLRPDGRVGRAVTTLATGRPADMADFARVLAVAETALCGRGR